MTQQRQAAGEDDLQHILDWEIDANPAADLGSQRSGYQSVELVKPELFLEPLEMIFCSPLQIPWAPNNPKYICIL